MMHSIVEYYAEHESYRCGYCRSPDTNFSHGECFPDYKRVYYPWIILPG